VLTATCSRQLRKAITDLAAKHGSYYDNDNEIGEFCSQSSKRFANRVLEFARLDAKRELM
jgi:hypothetical protein